MGAGRDWRVETRFADSGTQGFQRVEIFVFAAAVTVIARVAAKVAVTFRSMIPMSKVQVVAAGHAVGVPVQLER